MKVITPLTPVDPIVIWTNATCMSWMVNGSTLHQLIGLLFHHVWKELFLTSMDSLQVKDLHKKWLDFFPLFFDIFVCTEKYQKLTMLPIYQIQCWFCMIIWPNVNNVFLKRNLVTFNLNHTIWLWFLKDILIFFQQIKIPKIFLLFCVLKYISILKLQ